MDRTIRNLLNAVLFLAVCGLCYSTYRSIMGPLDFEAQRAERDSVVIKRLIMIKTAQEEYHAQHKGRYATHIDTLMNFVKTGAIPEVKKDYRLNDDQIDLLRRIKLKRDKLTDISEVMMSEKEADDLFLQIRSEYQAEMGKKKGRKDQFLIDDYMKLVAATDKVSAEDTITLNIGSEKISYVVEKGEAEIPSVGKMRIAGRTVAQVEKEMSEKLNTPVKVEFANIRFNRDTTYVKVIDKLFKNQLSDVDSMCYIPFNKENKKFLIETSASRNLFQATADYADYLQGIDDKELEMYILKEKRLATKIRKVYQYDENGDRKRHMVDGKEEDIFDAIPCRRIGDSEHANNNAGNWE